MWVCGSGVNTFLNAFDYRRGGEGGREEESERRGARDLPASNRPWCLSPGRKAAFTRLPFYCQAGQTLEKRLLPPCWILPRPQQRRSGAEEEEGSVWRAVVTMLLPKHASALLPSSYPPPQHTHMCAQTHKHTHTYT